MVITTDKLPALMNKGTGFISLFTNWITNFINWIYQLPFFVKLCIFIIVLFIMYCIFEVSRFIKYLQAEELRQQTLRGYSVKTKD